MNKKKYIVVLLYILLVAIIVVINHFFEQYSAYSVILFALLGLIALFNQKSNFYN